jgi:hypothetical protein
MAKLTLLDMVQDILSAMDSDPANSIDDTVESAQVATIVKQCYFDIVSDRDWPFLRTKFSLTGLGDTTRKTYMQLGEGYSKLLWVKYDGNDVTYLDPKSFQDMLDQREELADVVDSDGFVLNRDPMYYTTFDDELIVFDGIDTDVDSTLQTNKSVCYGVEVPTWTHEDSFVPNMPAKMFPMFLAEAKSTCFLNLKQQANAKEERKAQRGRHTFQNEVWRNNASEGKWNTKVAYGRK